ncbi:hypothetical protein J5U18_03500 [Sphingobacteriaceae bacterium WQ 2009]|uniref:KAP NTPase domain-containing protein n=1 Tax=Rhinopithecimicrobium faecis TaxID=2820698 RepID=A0A8T4H8N7_9SPHI|nr:hypothetical protein [Sphingobacteriaceae bacterium WQ 2009]
MWNDNETEEDLIDYKYLKDAVNNIIKQDHLLPCTIGIFGDWGSGKSSLIKMVECDHSQNNNELIIKFNGWLFEGYEDAKVALLETLVKELLNARTWDNEAKKYITKLFKRVKWLKTITAASKFGLGMYLTSQTDLTLEALGIDNKPFDLDNYLTEEKDENQGIIDKGNKEFHKDFSNLIKEAKLERVIVIIDDLDRCTPSTVIATLEAIKLFLFVDKTVFLIAADERLINYAVKSKFPNLPSSDYDVSQDYLEKLIQIPVRIPSLSELEYETFINMLFAKKHLQKAEFIKTLEKSFTNNTDPYSSKINFDNISSLMVEVQDELKNDLLLTKQLNPMLVQILSGNPRQCKRFLNMLFMRMNMAKSKGIDLKKIVLAKLMLLEYFKPESFNLLVKEFGNNDNNILRALEEQNNKIPITFNSWKSDQWLTKWLSIDPKLGSEDLNDYLYFTRTKVLEIKKNKRLSPKAKEFLVEILGVTLISKQAILRSKELAESDRSSLFSELLDRYHQAENKQDRANKNKLIFSFVQTNPELTTEYLAFLNNLPEEKVITPMVPNVVQYSTSFISIENKKAILEKWAKYGTKDISTVAKSKLSSL